MRGLLEYVLVMAYRQVKRFLRARSRLAGMALTNVLWLLFFGVGWSSTLKPVSAQVLGGLDYLAFLLPAAFVTSVFQASFMGGISVIWDKQFGFLKEVLVAPAPRALTILGRALGDSVNAVAVGVVMLSAGFLVSGGLEVRGLPFALLTGFVVGLTFNSLGIAMASAMRSPEGFQLVVGALTIPMIMLSGALFPITAVPEWMRVVALALPLSYAVDLCRYLLAGVSLLGEVYPWLTPPVIASLLVAFMTLLMAVAVRVFEKVTLE